MKTTRDRILDAAAAVMGSLGIARATTKEIAREAGFSEATLYKNFTDKSDLLLAVLAERMPSFVPLMKQLGERVGQGTLEGNLVEIARSASAFYTAIWPMTAGMFAEPRLLATHRDGLVRTGVGPHLANESLAAWLAAEQALGRVRPEVDVHAAAAMLLGACFQGVFLRSFVDPDRPPPSIVDPADVARMLAAAIAAPAAP